MKDENPMMNFRMMAKELKIKEPLLKKVLVDAGVINATRTLNPAVIDAGLAESIHVTKDGLQFQVPCYSLEYVKSLIDGTGVIFDPAPMAGFVRIEDVF